jgi:hypothetical protein
MKKSTTTKTGSLTVGTAEYEQAPLILGMEMLAIGDRDDEARGRVVTGSGCGSDAILLEWKGRAALVRGRDLLKAWMSQWAPEDAARLP